MLLFHTLLLRQVFWILTGVKEDKMITCMRKPTEGSCGHGSVLMSHPVLSQYQRISISPKCAHHPIQICLLDANMSIFLLDFTDYILSSLKMQRMLFRKLPTPK